MDPAISWKQVKPNVLLLNSDLTLGLDTTLRPSDGGRKWIPMTAFYYSAGG